MIDRLISLTGHRLSGYYMDHKILNETIAKCLALPERILIWGVSHALLDFVEEHTVELRPGDIVMETGGTKGRRKEMIREELHERLIQGFGTPAIHSEYGMTELLSQAYSEGGGLFHAVPWMKVFARDIYDPFTICTPGRSGAVNVIDLANIGSCSFIATDDLGTVYENGSFEIKGRLDSSEIRGCNLLV
jgi:hypothetical protein